MELVFNDDIVVSQAFSRASVKFCANIYCGKIVCPKCNDKGFLSLRSSGSFQVVHYVSRFHGKTRYRYCTLFSLGKLLFHAHRCFGIGIPLWVAPSDRLIH